MSGAFGISSIKDRWLSKIIGWHDVWILETIRLNCLDIAVVMLLWRLSHKIIILILIVRWRMFFIRVKWLQGRTHHMITSRWWIKLIWYPSILIVHVFVCINHLYSTSSSTGTRINHLIPSTHTLIVCIILMTLVPRSHRLLLLINDSISSVQLLELSLYVGMQPRMINQIGYLLWDHLSLLGE